jgi:hypothetical protein
VRFLFYRAEKSTFPNCLFCNELFVVPLQFQLDIRGFWKMFAPFFGPLASGNEDDRGRLRAHRLYRYKYLGFRQINSLVFSSSVSVQISRDHKRKRFNSRPLSNTICIIPSRRETLPIANHEASILIRRNKTNQFLT